MFIERISKPISDSSNRDTYLGKEYLSYGEAEAACTKNSRCTGFMRTLIHFEKNKKVHGIRSPYPGSYYCYRLYSGDTLVQSRRADIDHTYMKNKSC